MNDLGGRHFNEEWNFPIYHWRPFRDVMRCFKWQQNGRCMLGEQPMQGITIWKLMNYNLELTFGIWNKAKIVKLTVN